MDLIREEAKHVEMEYLWEMGRKTSKLLRMENEAYNKDPENGTELNLVEKSVVAAGRKSNKAVDFTNKLRETDGSTNSIQGKDSGKQKNKGKSQNNPAVASGGQDPPSPGPSTSCKPEVCQRARERYTAPDLRGSPWHRTKTIFLLATIGSLVVWAIIYSTLSQLDIV